MKKYYLLFAAALGLVIACNPDDDKNSSGASLMTKEEIALETYSGGKLGTTFNASASAYEDPTEAVSVAGMDNEFKYASISSSVPSILQASPSQVLAPLMSALPVSTATPATAMARGSTVIAQTTMETVTCW